MAVLQMQKLCICALKKDRKSLMEFLQAAGVLELSAEAEPDEVFKRTDTLEDRQKFERNAATADRALEVLAAVVPEETSMLAGLAGKPLAKAGAYRDGGERRGAFRSGGTHFEPAKADHGGKDCGA